MEHYIVWSLVSLAHGHIHQSQSKDHPAYHVAVAKTSQQCMCLEADSTRALLRLCPGKAVTYPDSPFAKSVSCMPDDTHSGANHLLQG